MTPDDVLNTENGFPEETIDDWYEDACAEAERLFDNASDLSEEYDTSISTTVEVGEPWRAIVTYVDHIIMGSYGRNDDSSLPLGSVAETVMRRSPVLVSIVR